MKKKWVSILLVICLLSGCTATENTVDTPIELEEVKQESIASAESSPNLQENWSDELVVLMEQVNVEHQTVMKPEVDWTLYDAYFPNGLDVSVANSKKEATELVSIEQALEDTEHLLKKLKASYVLYTCYEEFDSVYYNVKEKLQAQEQWAYNEFRDVLLSELSFLEDSHFFIDKYCPSTIEIPFFYREIKFKKSENGFYNIDGRVVESVDGYENLNEIFRRSLTKDGDIVYYPILFETISHPQYKDKDAIFETDVTLTVHYTDGSLDLLTADSFKVYREKIDEDFLVETKGDIPIFRSREISSLMFAQIGEELSESQVLIIDVARNQGGDSRFAFEWWNNYIGTSVPTNFYALSTIAPPYPTSEICGFIEQDEKIAGYAQTDAMTHCDNLTVLLSGSITASCAELFTDMARNVENTLIIGENTAGCLRANQSLSTVLPNSGIPVRFGNMIHIFPDNYFEECYGLEPDLWCPASEAEEAAINFIKKNMK